MIESTVTGLKENKVLGILLLEGELSLNTIPALRALPA